MLQAVLPLVRHACHHLPILPFPSLVWLVHTTGRGKGASSHVHVRVCDSVCVCVYVHLRMLLCACVCTPSQFDRSHLT